MKEEAPIELYAFDPETDVILARRVGEPSFVSVEDIGDAVEAAMVCEVSLVIPADLLAERRTRGELPPDWLPSCIVVE